jgi:hypothetical protein
VPPRFRAPRCLVASLLLAIGTLAGACSTQVITRSDQITTWCTEYCGHDAELLAYCTEQMERVLQAASAGCLEEFDEYFACRQGPYGGNACGVLGDTCDWGVYVPLVKCSRASPTYEPCRRAEDHLNACAGTDDYLMSYDFCDGKTLCHAQCISSMSCDEIVATLGSTQAPELDACIDACMASSGG